MLKQIWLVPLLFWLSVPLAAWIIIFINRGY